MAQVALKTETIVQMDRKKFIVIELKPLDIHLI